MTLHPIDYKSLGAKRDFVASLHETGFGVLTNHPLSQNDIQGMYDLWRGFFDSKAKLEYEWDRKTLAGFYPIEKSETAKGQDVKDIKEFYHFYTDGLCPPELRDQTFAYYTKATNLAIELIDWIEQESPTHVKELYTEPLSDMMRGAKRHLLRILHYPPQPNNQPTQSVMLSPRFIPESVFYTRSVVRSP